MIYKHIVKILSSKVTLSKFGVSYIKLHLGSRHRKILFLFHVLLVVIEFWSSFLCLILRCYFFLFFSVLCSTIICGYMMFLCSLLYCVMGLSLIIFRVPVGLMLLRSVLRLRLVALKISIIIVLTEPNNKDGFEHCVRPQCDLCD
jgi:hypothetical protein